MSNTRLFVTIVVFALFVTAQAQEGLVTRKFPDPDMGGSALGDVNDSYFLPGEGCKTSFHVSWNTKTPEKKNLGIRSTCALDWARTKARYKALMDAVVANHDAKKFDYVITHDLSVEMEERMALAASGSAKWNGYRRRLQKKWEPENGIFVDVFNDGDVGRDFADFFKAYGVRLKLTGVEKVFSKKAKELPFAKKHPGFAKSSKRLPYSAGIFEFRVIQ